MKKLIYLILTTFYSYSTIASEIPKNYLSKLYHESITNLSIKEEKCSGKKRVLSPKIFDGLTISLEQMNTILKYKNASAFITCVNPELLQFYRASTLLNISYPDPQLKNGDELISFHDLRKLKLELEFNNIDVLLRNRINKLEELNKPFNLISSFEAISNN